MAKADWYKRMAGEDDTSPALPYDDAPILTPTEIAERNARSAATRAKAEAAAAELKARKSAAISAGLAERATRMQGSSCGTVEQTGSPRAGCDCAACKRARARRTATQRERRARDRDRDLEWIENPGAAPRFREERFAKYNMTEEAYYALLKAQGGGCAICGATKPGGRGQGINGFHIDHDHTCCPTGESCGKCVRGLLCARCNTGLGYFKDAPEVLRRAAEYLES